MRVIIISFTDVLKEYATSQLFHSIFKEEYEITEDSGVYHYKDLSKISPVSEPNKTVLIFTGHYDNPKECSLPSFQGEWEGYKPEDVFTSIGIQLQNWPHRILFHNCYSAGLYTNMHIGLCYRLLSMIQDPSVLTYCYFYKAPRYKDIKDKDSFLGISPNVHVFRWSDDSIISSPQTHQNISTVLDHIYNYTEYSEETYTIVLDPVVIEPPQIPPGSLPFLPDLSHSRINRRRIAKGKPPLPSLI
jgi:hypothetical protein